MAGIQLPHIQANPEQQVNAPRIESHPLDVAGPMKEQASAINTAGHEVLRYRQQVMYQEADNKATQKDNEWQDWYNKEMNGDPTTGTTGLKYFKGDPKPAYEDFNKRAQEKLNELSAASGDEKWSDLTQTVVNRRLNHRAVESHNESLTEYGHLKYDWEKSGKDTSVDFAQKGMVSAAADVDPDHPETFGKIDAKIQDIGRPIVSFARSYGGAVDTENGTILTPQTKQEIAKKVSEGLYKTIDNLYNSDQGDGIAIKKAEAIKTQYADQLDPFHKDTLNDKASKAALKQKATDLAMKAVKSGDPEAFFDKADVPFEVKDKAAQIASEYKSHISNLTNLQAKANYGKAWDRVDAVMQSNTPYAGLQAMNDDLERTGFDWKKMSVPQKKSLESMVSAPKTSSESALNKMVGAFMGEDPNVNIRGMDQKTFSLLKAGLSGPDQKHYQAAYERMNIQSNAQMDSEYRAFGKELLDQGIGAGLYKKVGTSTLNNPILYPESDLKSRLDKRELLDTLQNLGPMTPDQRSKYIAKFVSDKLADKAFQPPQKPKFNGGGVAPGTTSPQGAAPAVKPEDVAKVAGSANEATRVSFALKYRAMNNGAIPTKAQLDEFMAKQMSGKARGDN